MNNLIKYIDENNARFIEELIEFLKIPSISNNAENKCDIENCAKWLQNHIKNIGFEKVDIYNTPGHPIVYAEYLKAGKDKPTVLIYGHYDVQPVDPLDLWTNPPFEPTIKDGKIFARGTTDDKGQLFIHLKSLETYLKNENSLPVNVKILLEGEEEIGSVNLVNFLKDNKELLKCNLVVISDTSMYAKGLPSICYGLRGLAYLQIDITGPNRDLHSGSYGGAVDNPINALSDLITKLKDEKGRILIDGFYDDVIPLSDKEREEFKRLPFNEEEFKKELEIDEVFGEVGYTTTERLSARPTLDCNGIWGGFQGEGAKTVLPSKAGAKISMRLIPNQDPKKVAKLFIDFINKIAPKSIKVIVTDLHGGKPSVTPIDTPAIKAAMVALKKGYGVEPVFMKEGGSIPIVNSFKEILGADTVLLGFGLPDENAHSPNEHLDLDNFHKGILSVTHYFEELSKI
ncbi:MAG: dipeptidase [Ignavibacteriae bacterium]|nr:dipeptidase [Ignavibacteriota bacterium]